MVRDQRAAGIPLELNLRCASSRGYPTKTNLVEPPTREVRRIILLTNRVKKGLLVLWCALGGLLWAQPQGDVFWLHARAGYPHQVAAQGVQVGLFSQRRLLCAKERLPLAVAAEGLPFLKERLRLLQEVAHRRDMEALEHRTARGLACAAWQGFEPQRGYRCLPVGQDHGSGRQRARLRSRQEGGWQKAPFAGGHRGAGARGADRDLAPFAPVAGRRLYQGRGKRWAEETRGVGRGGGAQAAPKAGA
jgi:hypothetical protein